eukprot:CAMPEP_0197436886 /NCGR_PEP_ID=MMETSP1175-20131217/4238_1 /TAXON_ID=1003142 /ORGANISM="Triceratium dubium, Strain CCMP147" /LENGTH=264 /DNA_ID=CAMNT_0042966277 /DNA_START=260 /DNA_END=1054 /DNA_ORIENTATION=+
MEYHWSEQEQQDAEFFSHDDAAYVHRGDGLSAYDEADGVDYVHRQLGATMGQYIAFQVFRILLPLVIFVFCFWCHDRRRGSDARGGQIFPPTVELTQEQIAAQEEDRKTMLKETLVFKGVVETDEEAPTPSSKEVVKGDIYIPSTSSVPVSTRLMEDPFAEDEAPTCPICMVEYEEGDTICWSPNPECTHAFHWECISQWLLKHDECPQCRNNYLNKSTPTEMGNEAAGEESGGSRQASLSPRASAVAFRIAVLRGDEGLYGSR